MIGLRLFATLAVGIAMVLAGLMAREISGRRPAQLVAAWAANVAVARRQPIPLHPARLMLRRLRDVELTIKWNPSVKERL